MSESNGLRSTIEHEYMKMFGDVVVGKYMEDGTPIKASSVTHDAEELAKRQKMYNQHAARSDGAELLEVVKTSVKKGRKSSTPKKVVKAKNSGDYPEELTPAVTAREVEQEFTKKPEPMVKKKAVYLHNKMGKIKMQVEAVLESEMAYCLVFNNEDDMIFTPNAGETLNFTDVQGDTTAVYYADTLFSWTDGNKKLMILFKTDDQ